MIWQVLEYAGSTALAWAALVAAVVFFAAVAGVFGWLVVGGLRKGVPFSRRIVRLGVPCLCVLAYLVAWLWAGPHLDHAWYRLQQDTTRRFATYAALTVATAFLPPLGSTGRHAFVHLATRDMGFGKGKPISVVHEAGHEIAHFVDEDYPGGVTTFDGRPVRAGFRFRATRRLPVLIALAEMPAARTARVVGTEAALFTNIFAEAQVKIQVAGGDAAADIVLATPAPDWIVGSDMPDAAALKRMAAGLASGGVMALHLDGRLLSRSRLKGILADFRKVFAHYRFWCVGRHDYVVTAGGNVLADELLELFDRTETFAAFTASDIYAPSELFACYMGTDYEIEPGLLDLPTFTHAAASWHAPRLAFADAPTNHLAEVRAAALTPYYIPPADWFLRGTTALAVWSALTNQIAAVQGARREVLLGFDAAERGAHSNALERWSMAAKVNPRDPLLANLADSLDLEGRRFLRLGNANGAMRCYENRLLIRPTDVVAVHNFGICLKKAGHWALAARVFTKAVMMDPLTDEHRYEMVETCAAAGLEDVACRQLDVLMKRHPNEPSLKLRAARLLASRANKAHDEARAIALAEEAVRLTGWKDHAYVQGLADVYIAAGRTVMGMGLKKKMKEMRFER